MDLTVSSENSEALPESPVKENPVSIEKQLEIIPASPKQPIFIQIEAHKLPESPKMKLSIEMNRPHQQPGISLVKEIQPKS